jgi:hypothetical protein
MALPKIDAPKYEITLPLTGKKVKFRPFNVKEQRNLLMAIESDENDNIQQSINDVLHNCLLTENVDVEKLPVVDIEYFFLQLRAKSVGEIVDVRYRCNNEVNGVMCSNIMETQINLTKINVQQDKKISADVQLNERFSVRLKYPDYKSVKAAMTFDDVNDLTFNLIANSVESIFDGEQFYYANEVESKEIVHFIESLSQDQFKKIEEFFNNLPRIVETISLKCGKCGFDHTIKVEGLENFFV